MSTVTNTNFLQPTGFKLIIDRKNFANIEWFAQSVDHPSVTVNPVDVPYSRVASIPMPGDKLEYGEVNFNIILDEEMNSYIEAHDWLKRTVEKNNVTATESTSTELPTECDITLVILNSSNKKLKNFVYRNAFPTNIGNISFGAEADDNPFLIPISFQYSYFDIV
jgi:hypothetical protein